MIHDPMAPQIDIFNTEISAARATVYVRLNRPPADGWSLAGEIRGPRCVTSDMLSARYTLRDLGPGPTTLARTALLDPVGWSAMLPALYDVHVEVRQHGRRVEEFKAPFALRWLDVRGAGIYRENRRFIVRGVERAALESLDTAALRAGELTLLHPYADELTAATDYGLLSIADVDVQSPAVGIVLQSPATPNLLFACRSNDPAGVSADAQIVLAEVDDPAAFAARWKDFSRPIIAVRPTARLAASAAREACDTFRRDLAPHGQYAGYLLTAVGQVSNLPGDFGY